MIGILILTILGFVSGMTIVLISNNSSNENIENLEKMLPGYNCNACGFGSCKGMATQAIKDKTLLKKCKPMSKEKYQKIIKEYFNEK